MRLPKKPAPWRVRAVCLSVDDKAANVAPVLSDYLSVIAVFWVAPFVSYFGSFFKCCYGAYCCIECFHNVWLCGCVLCLLSPPNTFWIYAFRA